MRYADGFLLPIHKDNLDAYRKMARKAGKIWMEHGALQYCECVGEDLAIPKVLSFTKSAKVKEGETVIFAWIVYKSRAHRDQVNAKVMADPRMAKIAPKDMPFDMKRMAYSGFEMLVDL
jgi:uncharacterized protein YbaA (DUF1428 family)